MDENQNNDPTGSAPDPETPGPDAPGPQSPGPQASGAQSPGPQAPGAQAPGPRVDRSEMRDLGRLRRSTTDRHVAGVAGGLARHFDIDPLIVRIAFVVLAFFGGAGIILYAAGWLLVPEDNDQRAPFDLDPRTRGFVLIGVAAVAGLSIIGDATDNGPGVWFPLPLIVIGGLVWLVLSRRSRREHQATYAATYGGTYAPPGYAAPGYAPPGYTPTGPGAQLAADAKADPDKYRDMAAWQVVGDPSSGYRWQRDPRKRGPKLFWIALPLIALALGTLGVIDLAGTRVIDAAYPALALGIVAALLLLGSFWGRAGGLIFLGLLLLPITAATTAAGEIDHETVHYTPLTVAEIPADGYYHLDAGELIVDLSKLTDPEALDGRGVSADVNVGRVEVIVPDDVDVRAEGHLSGPGTYELFETEGGGIDMHDSSTQDGGVDAPSWSITVKADVGEVVVHNASEAFDYDDRFDNDNDRDEDR